MGVIVLAKAFKLYCQKQEQKSFSINYLDLSINIDFGDEGAIALFDGLECYLMRNLSLPSCSICAQGAVMLGEVLGRIIHKTNYDDDNDDEKNDLF